MAEMKWFIDAAKKLQGQGREGDQVVSETITTHEYESKTLAKAFSEITGIKVKHDLIQEGDVVEKLQTSMQSGKSIYDGWISDSDLIGTHYRYGKIMNLTDYMAGRARSGPTPGWTSRTSSAPASPPRPTASSTSCPTSSSPTCTGSAPTCSRART
jgi:glycerol transport system substrate-binding protein